MSLKFDLKPWFKLPDYKPKEVKRMLKEKQRSIDAKEHHQQTIIKDEGLFEISDYAERKYLKSVSHLYGKRAEYANEETMASD